MLGNLFYIGWRLLFYLLIVICSVTIIFFVSLIVLPNTRLPPQEAASYIVSVYSVLFVVIYNGLIAAANSDWLSIASTYSHPPQLALLGAILFGCFTTYGMKSEKHSYEEERDIQPEWIRTRTGYRYEPGGGSITSTKTKNVDLHPELKRFANLFSVLSFVFLCYALFKSFQWGGSQGFTTALAIYLVPVSIFSGRLGCIFLAILTFFVLSFTVWAITG